MMPVAEQPAPVHAPALVVPALVVPVAAVLAGLVVPVAAVLAGPVGTARPSASQPSALAPAVSESPVGACWDALHHDHPWHHHAMSAGDDTPNAIP
jgi:hypothetical protein